MITETSLSGALPNILIFSSSITTGSIGISFPGFSRNRVTKPGWFSKESYPELRISTTLEADPGTIFLHRSLCLLKRLLVTIITGLLEAFFIKERVDHGQQG